jgi:hypothetical protein
MRSQPMNLNEIQDGIQASLTAALDELERLEAPLAQASRRRPPPLPNGRAAAPVPMRAFPPPLPTSSS